MATDEREPRRRRPLPTFSVIGGGRLGGALALALSRCGYTLESIVTLRAHRRRFALPEEPLHLTAASLGQIPASDLLLITTPDAAIAATARRLARIFQTRPRARRIALHTSGALASNELSALREVGFAVGSLHPLLSVREERAGAEALAGGANFCLEGERAALVAARQLVRALGGRAFSVETRDKALYHAAAVMSAGHLVALLGVARETLIRCRLSEANARALVVSLAQSALANFSAVGPGRALTGPYARGDGQTIGAHLEALRDPETRAAYVALGQLELRLAREQGLGRGAAARIGGLLRAAAPARKAPRRP